MEFYIVKRINASSIYDALERQYEAEIIDIKMTDGEDVPKKIESKLGYGR